MCVFFPPRLVGYKTQPQRKRFISLHIVSGVYLLCTELIQSLCHAKMGTVNAQMATDGESEVPLQI